MNGTVSDLENLNLDASSLFDFSSLADDTLEPSSKQHPGSTFSLQAIDNLNLNDSSFFNLSPPESNQTPIDEVIVNFQNSNFSSLGFDVKKVEKENHTSVIFPDRAPICYKATANDYDTLDGFNLDEGKTWQYPTAFDLRKYQFVISERCLYQNCLVCIPTGLGKTFIAAVILHNFLRWYPEGRVVFMAPTRPLVSQQMEACRRFTQMSEIDTLTELTGSTAPKQRVELWTRFRAFFLTPQVIVNDLVSGICPANSICCIVVDEAHKATGNHAYCQVIRIITNPPYNHRQFRILALSATPASDLIGAQVVIGNLLISHLEIRTEECDDIQRFSYQRDIETVVVDLDSQLSKFKARLCDIARAPLQRLCKRHALWCRTDKVNPEAFAKFTLVKAREAVTRDPSMQHSPFFGNIHRDFQTAICLAHALELLVQYGLRSVYHFLLPHLDSGTNNADLANVDGVREIISEIGGLFGVQSAAIQSQIPFVAGHPKLFKLHDILKDHFSAAMPPPALACLSQTSGTTRAIVFTQFRDSVMEIMHMLNRSAPLLRPAVFVGQSAASNPGKHVLKKKNTQRDQLRVLHDFREGIVNILVSTCIGEEGLDVGQVDLIVCFDAYKSPIRLIQRFGRTGRKRLGRVVVLLTKGREENNFAQSMARSSTVHEALLQGQINKQLSFYPHNPRMVPLGLDPVPVAWIPTEREREEDFRDSGALSLREAILSNWRKYKLASSDFNFKRFSPAPLISSKENVGDSSGVTFVDTYKCLNIPSIREDFQKGVYTKENNMGPSSSTWHIVAVLRLIELHRRGITHAMFHATGHRTVDMSRSLSELIPYVSSQLTQTLHPTILLKPAPVKKHLVELSSKEVTNTVKLVRGLVSGTIFVDPRFTGVPEWEGCSSAETITLEGLNRAFASLLDSVPPPHPDNISSDESIDTKPLGSTSVIFDSAFGLPAPLFYSSSPQAKKMRLDTGSSPFIFPSTLLIKPSPIQPKNTGILGNAGNLLFNSRLQFDEEMSDFLQATQDNPP